MTSPATGQEMEEWEETWNTMEPFTVTVVPSDQSDHDLFQDMQPVLKKTKKVIIYYSDVITLIVTMETGIHRRTKGS